MMTNTMMTNTMRKTSTLSAHRIPTGIWTVLALLTSMACSHSIPGTHVEVLNKSGTMTYVGGAAGQAKAKSQACQMAVLRSTNAIADEFANREQKVAEAIAKSLDLSDGRPLLAQYAKKQVLDAAVQEVKYNPADFTCMASVRWKAPVFVKDAVMKYAHEAKERELGSPDPSGTSGENRGSSEAQPNPCTHEERAVRDALRERKKHKDKLNECLRKTEGDESICHRYVLYDQEAASAEESAQSALQGCRETL